MVNTVHRGIVTVLRRLNTITGEHRRNQFMKETQETNNALCSRKQLMQKIAELVLRHPERVKKQDSQKAKKQEPQAYTSS
ncbi:unnamed protein product [Arabis nemorensis]|uniref:Uncharacterized protein n=1 Tax=Arabis nemorensis TaxID=586526 RepID=A0A565AWR7_9BRAS|nr:unnamed protein product [Arabis nemorensis]